MKNVTSLKNTLSNMFTQFNILNGFNDQNDYPEDNIVETKENSQKNSSVVENTATAAAMGFVIVDKDPSASKGAEKSEEKSAEKKKGLFVGIKDAVVSLALFLASPFIAIANVCKFLALGAKKMCTRTPKLPVVDSELGQGK